MFVKGRIQGRGAAEMNPGEGWDLLKFNQKVIEAKTTSCV